MKTNDEKSLIIKNKDCRKIKIIDLIIQESKSKLLSSQGKSLGKYPLFSNKTDNSFCYFDEYLIDGEYIIANTGGAAFFNYYYGKFSFSSDCFVFKSKENTKFLFQYLKHNEKNINKNGFYGSGIKHLDKKWFLNQYIYLPDAKTQEKIGKMLQALDELILLHEEKLAALETYNKGLRQKLFNQSVRFKRPDGSSYPEWKYKKITDISTITGGGTPDTKNATYWNGEIPWFTPSEIGKDKYVINSQRSITDEAIKNSSAKLLPINTILLSTRATLGEMAIAKSICSTNQGFQSLIVNKDISFEYVYYLKDIIKKYCIKYASGSTFLEISKNQLAKCTVPIPFLEEQQKIAEVLSCADELTEQIKNKILLLKITKTSLLNDIFD